MSVRQIAPICPNGNQARFEGRAEGRCILFRLVFSPSPLKLRFDRIYSKRVPVAVEQPVLYTSPFRR